jgi:hypothetical protein
LDRESFVRVNRTPRKFRDRISSTSTRIDISDPKDMLAFLIALSLPFLLLGITLALPALLFFMSIAVTSTFMYHGIQYAVQDFQKSWFLLTVKNEDRDSKPSITSTVFPTKRSMSSLSPLETIPEHPMPRRLRCFKERDFKFTPRRSVQFD